MNNLPDNIEIQNADALDAFIQGYEFQIEGDIDLAERYYRISLDYQSTAEAHTFLGWALSQKNEIDRAIEHCKEAIELDPDFGNPYNDIGVYLLEKGDMKQAKTWFSMALEAPRYESYCFPYFNLGRVAMMRGHFESAAHYFRKAIEEQPEFKKAKFALHRVKSRLN